MASDPQPTGPEFYIGAMTGTSIDGLDLCLCDFATPTPRLVAHHQHLLDESLATTLRQLARAQTGGPHPEPAQDAIDRLGVADRQLAEAVAAGVDRLLADAKIPASAIRAIGSHGQTVRHRPGWGDTSFTLQLGDPSRIAELTGITVTADFRRRDMAAGGQGAPLAPPAHAALFPPGAEGRIVINLGGIANASILLPGAEPLGFDTGPANTLMDAWHARHRGGPFDHDGRWAASGQVSKPLLTTLLSDPFFASPAPKSTGPEHFHLDWLRRRGAEQLTSLPAEDVQATLLELTVESVAGAIAPWLDERPAMPVTLCGGGAYNQRLVERLRERLDTSVESSAALGIAPECVEGAAFAWLARQLLNGRPGNAPAVTGAAGPRVLGGIYPA
ncbi:anhydro-N-acetylmuramic acid kinase [Guyparkeria hydrothermalis]|uniref:anhydro-N-acetylmuramic acid kinase n=1 Tax=Guyparkeria hydrothermalis TaxID=923 RepID=UPI0032E402C3